MALLSALGLDARRGIEVVGFVLLACLSGWSAAVVKESHSLPALAGVRLTYEEATRLEPSPGPLLSESVVEPVLAGAVVEPAGEDASPRLWSPEIRFFNGRPVRPARTMWMTVTAYSPDARSCGPFADGRTATLHSVNTNAHRLVAADPRVLPYGSMVSVPGYDQGRIVPVLDCGGKIKGRRLDVLYPTHEQARRWGVQRLRVTVWEYADGLPAENPRRER